MDRTLLLIKRVQAGDEQSKEILIKENIGLIWSVVKRFGGRGFDLEDLFQVGAIGLLKCIEKFDLSYNVKFSTYAVPMIVGEIKRFLRDDGMIKVSRPLKEIAIKARFQQDYLQKQNGAQPTVSELAAAVGVSEEELVMALDAARDVESLHSPIFQGDGGPVCLLDKLEQDSASDDNMVDRIALRETIEKLDPKEQRIVMLRYFEDKTQTEIAEEIGVSQVQVSRIEKRILKTMRESMAPR